MSKIKEVQFVCFETELDQDEFMVRWKKYTGSLHSKADVVIHRSPVKGKFKYIAQHFITGSPLQFTFSQEGVRSKVVQVSIKTTLAGGYSLLQKGRHAPAKKIKNVFAFINDPQADLKKFNSLSSSAPYIYEAYYENCRHAYILEYFTDSHDAAELLEQLKQQGADEAGIYEEFCRIKDSGTDKSPKKFVWPG